MATPRRRTAAVVATALWHVSIRKDNDNDCALRAIRTPNEGALQGRDLEVVRTSANLFARKAGLSLKEVAILIFAA